MGRGDGVEEMRRELDDLHPTIASDGLSCW